MRRLTIALATLALVGCGAASTPPSGFTETLAFDGKTEQDAGELQYRLDEMHERFGIEPGSDADQDTQWLLLDLDGGWVTVDKLLDCIDARLELGEPDPELTAYATECAAGLEAEYEQGFGE